MRITTKTRYAVRALYRLASYKGGEATLKEIARREGISVKYLEHIFPALVKSGLIESSRGLKGGYKLKRKLSEISLMEIIRAVGEGVFVSECVEQNKPFDCPFENLCEAEKFWKKVRKRIQKVFESTKLEENNE